MCKNCRPEIAAADLKKYRKTLDRLQPKKSIPLLPELHRDAFSGINCLQCANCCKHHGPTFRPPDIKRVAKFLGMKESAFIAQYLRIDEDEDYVTQILPCPFLGADNYCGIYEVRPTDCRRYPYTDEDVLVRKKSLTIKNVEVCPAVQHVLDALQKTLG